MHLFLVLSLLFLSSYSYRVLATGGTGYIGSHTVVELIKQGHYVEIVDDLSNSKYSVLERIKRITGVTPKFHKCDCGDEEKMDRIFKEGRFDSVIHFAGYKAVAESVEQPLKYYQNNILSTLVILRLMKKYSVKQIIFSSSATVYGYSESVPFTEDLPTGGTIASPYGKTKYMIEEILKDESIANPSLSVILLRYFNPIGNDPSGLLGEDPLGIPNNLMPIIMRVNEGILPQLHIYGSDYNTSDGSCIRDYIHVVDLAKGHIASLKRREGGVEVYNLGTGRGTSVFEMVDKFEKVSGKTLNKVVDGRRKGDIEKCWADPSKAFRELNWKTELTVDDAFRDTLTYLQKEREPNKEFDEIDKKFAEDEKRRELFAEKLKLKENSRFPFVPTPSSSSQSSSSVTSSPEPQRYTPKSLIIILLLLLCCCCYLAYKLYLSNNQSRRLI